MATIYKLRAVVEVPWPYHLILNDPQKLRLPDNQGVYVKEVSALLHDPLHSQSKSPASRSKRPYVTSSCPQPAKACELELERKNSLSICMWPPIRQLLPLPRNLNRPTRFAEHISIEQSLRRMTCNTHCSTIASSGTVKEVLFSSRLTRLCNLGSNGWLFCSRFDS